MKKIILISAILLGVIGIASAAVISGDLTNGLVSYYDFNGNLNDLSGNGNNLSALTAGTEITVNGGRQSLFLSTIDDSVRSVKNLGITGNQDHSISVWIKASFPSYPVGGSIVTFGDPSIVGGVNSLRIEDTSSGRIELWGQYADWNAPNLNVGMSAGRFSEWSMITYVYSNSLLNSQIYINGNLVSSEASGSYLVNSYNIADSPLTIGRFIESDSFGGGLDKGYLDDLFIYNRALSSTDVTQLYLATIPEPSEYALISLGLSALAIAYRRRAKTA